LLLAYPDAGIRTVDPAIRRVTTPPYPYCVFYEATETEIIIHAAHALRTEDGKQVAADHRPDNPQNDIQNQTLALLVDDFAGDERLPRSPG
jgi:hypothetical protein